jgi:inward rectifier potassium channel
MEDSSNKRSALETQFLNTGSKLREEEGEDLGLDQEGTPRLTRRMVNRDGSFNVTRKGYGIFKSRSLYHYFLTISASKFFAIIFGFYLSLNLLFALFFYLCGPGAIVGTTDSGERFFDCFFFSIQTFATIGYGILSPHGIIPNSLVMIEAFIGLLTVALVTGLFFSRFSRPTARIIFSHQAVIAPFQDRTSLQFRIANERQNQIIDLKARVVLSRLEPQGNIKIRKFHDLHLERSQVMFFPLLWTLVHDINDKSPLYNTTNKELEAIDAEILVLLSGTDDTFSQTVHTWTSYKPTEIVWGAKFKHILDENDKGYVSIDLHRLHEIEMS